MSSPTVQQWQALYEAASAIKALAPWETLWDSDLVTLHLPGLDEPVFCSTMGRLGECHGIAVYPGYEALADYDRTARAEYGLLPMGGGHDARHMICFFGDREETLPEDREVIRQIGLKFRGHNNWIYFRAAEPGYVPWFLNAGQADLLIEALRHYAIAFEAMNKQPIEVDFRNGETLTRFYSPEKDLWVNAAAIMPEVPDARDAYTIENELFTAKLKLQRKTNATLELDMVYMPVPVRDTKDSVPYFPRLVILADRQNGMILDQDLAAPEQSFEETVMELLERHILANGRPRTLFVRDGRMAGIVGDFCAKTDIRLMDDGNMLVMDDIILNMIAYFENET